MIEQHDYLTLLRFKPFTQEQIVVLLHSYRNSLRMQQTQIAFQTEGDHL